MRPKKYVQLVSAELKKIIKRRDVLELLVTSPNFGLERWLQVELAARLIQLGKPMLECPHRYDKRKGLPPKKAASGRESAFVDLEFVAKNTLRDRSVAIEIKVNKTLKGLGPLLTDFQRVDAIVESDWSFRAVIGILFFQTENGREGKFSRISDALVTRFGARRIDGKEGHHFLVFGWERGLTKNMSRQDYSDWVQKVQSVFVENGVDRRTVRRA